MLYHGISLADVKKYIDPEAKDGDGYVTFETDEGYRIIVKEFPGDCGACILQSAYAADGVSLKKVVKYVEMSGYSKVFATLVGDDHMVPMFEKFGFKIVASGTSARKEGRFSDVVLLRYNDKPKRMAYNVKWTDEQYKAAFGDDE